MERPAKRMRMWRPEQPSSPSTTTQIMPSAASHPQQIEQQLAVLPTRTIDLSDFRRRAFHAYRSRDGDTTQRRKGVIYLMPRAPVATVTAKVIDVALDDGLDPTRVTQIAEPSSDLVVPIGTIGTLTIPGAEVITSAADSLISQITGTSLSSSSGLSSASLSGSASLNGTSVASGENTVTVTATSTLTVSFRNGTLIAPPRTSGSRGPSSSNQRILGLTTTTEGDASSTPITDAGSKNPAAGPTSSGNTGMVVTGTSSSPEATASQSGGSGITLSPQQQQVVGGVVGGVAGVALVLVALLYFLKWYRQRLKRLGQLPEQLAASRDVVTRGDGERVNDDHTPTRPQTAETQRSSIGPIAAIATRLKQLRPYSTNTVSTASTRESLPSGAGEKSFQRVAGRKIPSVLSAGGDGYGGNFGAFDQSMHQRDESQTSIYQDEFINARPFTRGQQSSMSEPTTPVQADPFADPPSIERMQQSARRSFSPTPNFSRPSLSRDFGAPNVRSYSSADVRPQFSTVVPPADGFATLRPSPARMPITQSHTPSAVRLPQPSSTPPLMAGNVPDLPTIPALSLPPKRKTDRAGQKAGLEAASPTSASSRFPNKLGGRASSTGGRFREDID